MTVRAWEFDVYDSTGCQQGFLNDYSGSEDQACTPITEATRDKFVIDSMGECSIELYSGSDSTCPESNFQQIYDASEEGECITPRFTWNYFLVTAC
jgi:hypothetical protein